MFVQDVFAEAKALGLTNGFVGTYNDLHQALLEATEPVDPDEDGTLAYIRYLESDPRQADEEEQDRARNPFDRQTGAFFAEYAFAA